LVFCAKQIFQFLDVKMPQAIRFHLGSPAKADFAWVSVISSAEIRCTFHKQLPALGSHKGKEVGSDN
jgi:hypothetical protein